MYEARLGNCKEPDLTEAERSLGRLGPKLRSLHLSWLLLKGHRKGSETDVWTYRGWTMTKAGQWEIR